MIGIEKSRDDLSIAGERLSAKKGNQVCITFASFSSSVLTEQSRTVAHAQAFPLRWHSILFLSSSL